MCEQRVELPRLYRFSLSTLTVIAMIFVAAIPIGSANLANDTSANQGCRKDEAKTDEGCVKNPKLIQRVEPSYPPQAWKAHAEGSVTLSARVNEKGHVEDTKVVSSHATDDACISSFETAALAALHQWRYRPATLNGKPVSLHFEVTIEFHMGH